MNQTEIERPHIECSQNLNNWLDEEIEVSIKFSSPINVPRWQRLSYLVICNGSFDVNGYGFISYGGGPFPQGLEQDEAYELMYYRPFIDGVVFESGDYQLFDKLNAMIEIYYKHFENIYENGIMEE